MAGMSGTRITMTIQPKQYEILAQVAESMCRKPGDLAKEMVLEGIGFLEELISSISPNDTTDRAMNKMFKQSLNKIVQTLDDMGEEVF